MRIALLSDCYLPRLGGIEVQVRDLAHRLAAAGHEVEVFTATVGDDGARGGVIEVNDLVRVHRMGIRLPGKLPMNPLAAPELRRRLEAGRFDVAHVHMGITSPFTVDSTRVALEVGLPVAMTWHCMLGPAEPGFQTLRIARSWARKGVAMNAVSATAAEPVQRIVGGEGVVQVLPNGIDAARWWRHSTPTHPIHPPTHDGELHIVSAMRFAVRKRPGPMLMVLQRVRELAPEVPIRVTILGTGRLRGAISRYVKREGMEDWVDLPGRVSRQELLARYTQSHIYVSPARLESFGIAALEARCVGLPVVGLHTSGASEFIHDGVNGYLAMDDDGMASAIARLLKDHALRERMFRYNVTVPPLQDWSHVIDVTVAEYERAAALRGVRPSRRAAVLR